MNLYFRINLFSVISTLSVLTDLLYIWNLFLIKHSLPKIKSPFSIFIPCNGNKSKNYSFSFKKDIHLVFVSFLHTYYNIYFLHILSLYFFLPQVILCFYFLLALLIFLYYLFNIFWLYLVLFLCFFDNKLFHSFFIYNEKFVMFHFFHLC